MDYTDILAYIRQIMRFIHIESKLLDKEMGISIPQLLTLHYLNKQESYTSQPGGIGHYLVLNPSTVTGIISRLEKKGAIARIPGDQDRRKSWIILTKKGKSLLESSLARLEEKFANRVEGKSPGYEEKLVLSFEEIIAFLKVKEAEAEAAIRDINDGKG
jgi:DNA-binding MarR family transcriptional regulator